MMSFILKYKIITPCQNGFYPGISTEDATYSLCKYIYDSLDRGEYVGVLFFDLSKAFDVIDTSIIVSKLEGLGFRGNFLKFLKSYLNGRQITVKVEDKHSDLYHMKLGVPQGSIMGPLIFLLFVNDMPAHISTNNLVLYADDTTVAVHTESPLEIKSKLNLVASEFVHWCKRNSLIVNTNKTVFMLFHTKSQSAAQINVTVDGNNIYPSTTTKFLGLLLDSDMSYSSNIDNISKK
nr:unnamed protein product [Callosobruchus analis]